jgi:hypothetical protein
MIHAYVERFDVMGGRGNILGWLGSEQGQSVYRGHRYNGLIVRSIVWEENVTMVWILKMNAVLPAA